MQKIDNFYGLLGKYHEKVEPRLKTFIDLFIKGKKGRWLAGGAIRRAIKDGKSDSDWDVFFSSKEEKELFIKECEKQDSISEEKQNENNHQFILTVGAEKYTVQCITIAYYETPEKVIETFDFTICQFVTDGVSLWAGETSLYDLGRMRLVVNKISYPVASLRRLLKYTKQGFYACNGCLTQLLSSVAQNPAMLDQKFKYID
jgi:hypothetical protein